MSAQAARSWRAWLACALHRRRDEDDVLIVLSTFVVCYVLFSR